MRPVLLCSLIATTAATARLSDCRFIANQEWCRLPNGTLFQLQCHAKRGQTWCRDADGTTFLRGQSSFMLNATDVPDATVKATSASLVEDESTSCYFHAGIQHCRSSSRFSGACTTSHHDFNKRLRIGAVFVVVVTSAVAVLSPVLLTQSGSLDTMSGLFVFLKNFGAGVVISTALGHLMTRANLLFTSECLGHLRYEGCVAVFVILGILIAFLVQYVGWRNVIGRRLGSAPAGKKAIEDWLEKSQGIADTTAGRPVKPGLGAIAEEREIEIVWPLPGRASGASVAKTQNDKRSTTSTVIDVIQAGDGAAPGFHDIELLSVLLMELGLLCQGGLVGLTCVITPNEDFGHVLTATIILQIFQGLALAARIVDTDLRQCRQILCCTCFVLFTPLGMGVGIAVLNHFNGNEPALIWTLGILNSIAAGILLWIGLVEMLSASWLWGDMRRAHCGRVVPGLLALVCGLVAVSILGRWV